ncbi:hypothetical protein FQN50_008821 [Emmonsiellopsis sp. PD_5]|nr:hypothetical protein FQN50_008821 [Emmonsiellopsis sp. PD_5]
MVDFPLLSHIVPQWDQGKPKPIIEGPSEECQHSLVKLAFNLGFETSEIRSLKAVNLVYDLASKFLKWVCPPEHYNLDEALLNSIVGYIAKHLLMAAQLQPLNQLLEFTINL